MAVKKEAAHYHVKRIVAMAVSLFILVVLYTFKNISTWTRAGSTIWLVLVFYIIDHYLNLKFRWRHYIFILFIATASFFLSQLYFLVPSYDKFLHFIQPVMLSSIVFHLVTKLKIKTHWKLIFTFFIVLGSVGLFELGEYGLDYIFDSKLQGVFIRDLQSFEKLNILMDRLDDTMIDMALGFLGAAGYLLAGAFLFDRIKNIHYL
ncbi:hypothetical protein J4461_02305 [Candidatus Pacearchaeota archaeon]|nr:hypothetical protein [Candidatus Pacearchaeota archaeon]